MAYSEVLADRVRIFLASQANVEEKKLMGGLAFMVNDKMCVGVSNDDLMVRHDPEIKDQLLERNGCRPMDFTGRPMKAFVFVGPEGTDSDSELKYWIDVALEYNPRAKSSKKK